MTENTPQRSMTASNRPSLCYAEIAAWVLVLWSLCFLAQIALGVETPYLRTNTIRYRVPRGRAGCHCTPLTYMNTCTVWGGEFSLLVPPTCCRIDPDT